LSCVDVPDEEDPGTEDELPSITDEDEKDEDERLSITPLDDEDRMSVPLDNTTEELLRSSAFSTESLPHPVTQVKVETKIKVSNSRNLYRIKRPFSETNYISSFKLKSI
jgi:hypothetical protein